MGGRVSSRQVGLTGRWSRRTQVGLQFLGIQPDITTLLNNLDAKKPDFDKAGLKILDVRSLIRDSVSIQQQGAKELGSSVRSSNPLCPISPVRCAPAH